MSSLLLFPDTLVVEDKAGISLLSINKAILYNNFKKWKLV